MTMSLAALQEECPPRDVDIELTASAVDPLWRTPRLSKRMKLGPFENVLTQALWLVGGTLLISQLMSRKGCVSIIHLYSASSALLYKYWHSSVLWLSLKSTLLRELTGTALLEHPLHLINYQFL